MPCHPFVTLHNLRWGKAESLPHMCQVVLPGFSYPCSQSKQFGVIRFLPDIQGDKSGTGNAAHNAANFLVSKVGKGHAGLRTK
jgi:hypothetical protein